MPKQTFFNLPETKQQAILDVAIEEFAANDYKAVSISRIVARTGIAKGSFYQYFEDKQDLYLYLIRLAADEKQRFFQHNPPPGDEAGAFDHLRWMFQVGLDFEFSNPRLARIGYRAVYGDAPLPKGTQVAVRGSSVQFFRQLVDQGVAQGDIDADLDPDLVAFMMGAIMTQLGYYLLPRLDVTPEALLEQGPRALAGAGLEPIVADLIAILERGLSPP